MAHYASRLRYAFRMCWRERLYPRKYGFQQEADSRDTSGDNNEDVRYRQQTISVRGGCENVSDILVESFSRSAPVTQCGSGLHFPK